MKYLLTTICFILLCSCSKEMQVLKPTFDVSAESSTYKIGDSVVFKFQGDNVDIISFYSGEGDADYDYLNTDRIYESTNTLSFYSAKYAGYNPDCATLKYSTDFNGVYDVASIELATWTDIADRLHIPDINGNSAIYEYSKEVDISDIFIAEDKPVYFAWFFNTLENSGRTRFRVQKFQVRSVIPQDTILSTVSYNFVNCNFKMILGNAWASETSNLPAVTSTDIVWDGPYSNTTYKEGWAISAPIYPSKEVNIGTATSVGIKSLVDPLPKTYQHIYNRSGTYMATFVAKNATIDNSKEVVRQIKIIVQE